MPFFVLFVGVLVAYETIAYFTRRSDKPHGGWNDICEEGRRDRVRRFQNRGDINHEGYE